MPRSLRDCWARIERADQHIGDLSGRITRFIEAKPYTFRYERNPKLFGKPLALMAFCDDRVVGRQLETFGVLTGEIVHHWRSALNHVIYRFWRGRKTLDLEYPIFLSSKKYETDSLRKIKGVELWTARALIQKSQPFKSGYSHSPLWLIHQLDIRDKHHLVVVMCGSLKFHKNEGLGRKESVGTAAYLPVGGLKDGAVVAYPAQRPVNMQHEAAPEVVLPKIGRVPSEPLIPRLVEISHHMRGLIKAFSKLG